MKKIRLLVFGAKGRMGQELIHLLEVFKDFELVAAIDKGTPLSKVDAESIDMAIDFSNASAIGKIIDWCSHYRVPLVSGTTGINRATEKQLRLLAKKTAVLWAPNMSLGVQVMNLCLAQMVELTREHGFDYQLEELHHRRKVDRPSGTAKLLQSTLRARAQAPSVLSIRGGGIFGVHRLLAMGEEETLLLEHTALNRRVFARGALQAARWLQGRRAGQYQLSDVVMNPNE